MKDTASHGASPVTGGGFGDEPKKELYDWILKAEGRAGGCLGASSTDGLGAASGVTGSISRGGNGPTDCLEADVDFWDESSPPRMLKLRNLT